MVALNALSDTELLLFLKEGSKDAFAEIYNRYKGLLYIHAYKKLWNQEEADDIVHDLFAALWDKREELVITGQLSGYLYTATRNRILKLIARKQTASSYITSITKSINEGYCVTDHLVRENQLTALIEKEIASLPPKMRQVFELSRKANLSHREIAGQLNLSEETVKKHVHHALKILKVKLGLLVYMLFLFDS